MRNDALAEIIELYSLETALRRGRQREAASGLLSKKASRALRLTIFLLIKYWLFSWPQNEISARFPRLLEIKINKIK